MKSKHIQIGVVWQVVERRSLTSEASLFSLRMAGPALETPIMREIKLVMTMVDFILPESVN
ncbi:MAG: hypothetical protein CL912_01650 [Deltaproteobacteria bacterium]|nr:hypothetical protein [Deltaproteobacteria bacterium]